MIKDNPRYLLIKSIFWQSLVSIILFSFIVAILKFLTIDLTGAMWYVNELYADYQIIIDILAQNPSANLTEAQQTIRQFYPIYNFLIFSSTFILLFIPIYGSLFVVGRQGYRTISQEDFGNENWQNSIKFPFSSLKHTVFTCSVIVFGSMLTILGFFLLIFPGFMLFIFICYLIFTFLVDEYKGKESFKGALFYLRGNFGKLFLITGIILIGMLLLNLILQPILMQFFGLTMENYYQWINPTDFQLMKVFLFEFVYYLLQSLFFFPVTFLIIPLFHASRKEKLIMIDQVSNSKIIQPNFNNINSENINSETINAKNSKTDERNFDDEMIRIIKVSSELTQYKCQNCSQILPISSPKCFKCGQLHDIQRFSKK